MGAGHVAGRRGEEIAAEYLRRQGFVILAANYRHQRKEIDLVARGEGYVVFVEVKLRRSAAFGDPAAAVDARKQASIVACARAFLSERRLGGLPVRFDVVAIRERGDQPEIELIRNAFRPRRA
jgi:putative endonuclease